MEGRLDALIDIVYERYKDRYFPGEKVFVDLSGDKYFARISRVFPPATVRAAHPDQKEWEVYLHRLGTDLLVDLDECKRDDDPEEYLYTVQLMDEEHKFEGSFMEVKAKSLSCVPSRITFQSDPRHLAQSSPDVTAWRSQNRS